MEQAKQMVARLAEVMVPCPECGHLAEPLNDICNLAGEVPKYPLLRVHCDDCDGTGRVGGGERDARGERVIRDGEWPWIPDLYPCDDEETGCAGSRQRDVSPEVAVAVLVRILRRQQWLGVVLLATKFIDTMDGVAAILAAALEHEGVEVTQDA